MKSVIITTITALLMVITLSGQNQWQIGNEGFGLSPIPGSVDFINDDTGWIAGETGIFQTTNGCKNWTLQNDSFFFRDIDFIDEMTGWAVASGDSILKTKDGGQTWNYMKQFAPTVEGIQPVNDTTLVLNGDTILIWDYLKLFEGQLNELQVIDDSTLFVSGDSILIKWNNGPNWEIITPPTGTRFSFSHFINSTTGIVVSNGNTIHRTIDGGDTWDCVELSWFSEISFMQFTNDSTAYFLAWTLNDTVTHQICETTNYFNTWTVLSTTELPIRSCHFFDNDALLVTISDENEGALDLMKSHDGGLTWKPIDTFTQLGLFDGFCGTTSDKMVFIGNTGYYFYRGYFIRKSVDQGDHWTCIHISSDLLDLDFIDRDRGFIVGGWYGWHCAQGLLYKTEDGGNSWNHIYHSSGEGIPSVEFINDSEGFLTTHEVDPRMLYSTSDGGYSWFADSTFDEVMELFFLNDSTGWAFAHWFDETHLGRLNGIFHTKNQGKDWEIFPGFDSTVTSPYIHSSCFINEKTGWIVGNLQNGSYPEYYKNLLMKYTEEDGWVSKNPGTDLPLSKVTFFDQEHGWISGGFGSQSWEDIFMPLFLRSVDGGENWSQITGLDYVINDFHFEDRDHGWAVGEDKDEKGVILETFDGGLVWKVVMDALPASLNSLDFADGYGWAVGDNGLILNLGYPPVPEIKDAASKFMVVADLHHISPSPDLDQSMLFEFAMAAIDEEVDFMFIPGDLIIRKIEDLATQDSLLHDWYFILETLASHNIRLFACRGNNDTGSGPVWDSLFSGIYRFPQNGPEGEKNLTYAIEYDNLVFISLDQYSNNHKVNQDWLDEILATTSTSHIFAAGHEPAFKIYKSDYLGMHPEDRNLFWESLTDAGAHAYFSGHAHFYDHALIDDHDGDTCTDVHQVIVGTGGGYMHPDADYDGDNGRWTPQRWQHREENGYVLVELEGDTAKMIWKHRTGPGVFEFGGDSATFFCAPTIIDATERNEIPMNADQLFQNYPNPFNLSTTISYQLTDISHVELRVFNLVGHQIATIDKGIQATGTHSFQWKPKELKPGIYIFELLSNKGSQIIKMIATE